MFKRTKTGRKSPMVSVMEQLEKRQLFALTVAPLDVPDAAAAMSNAILGATPGITVTSTAYTGNDDQGGTFTGMALASGSTALSMRNGVLLTTGEAANAVGTNNILFDKSRNWNTSGDSALLAASGALATKDANTLSLTFTKAAGIDTLSLDMLFGTEEVPGRLGLISLNDVVGIYLDGQQIAIDSNSDHIGALSSAVTLNNTGLPMMGKTSVSLPMNYDTLTKVIRTTVSLNNNLSSHTLKIVIVDAGDGLLDSGLFVSNLVGTASNSGGSNTPGTTEAPSRGILEVAANVSVNNVSGTVDIIVNRIGGSDGVLSALFSTADGSALAGLNYVPTSGLITFGDGETSKIISIPLLSGAQNAASSTLSMLLSPTDPESALGDALTSIIEVTNTLSLISTVPQVNVENLAGIASVTISRTGNTDVAATVDFTTVDGTAVGGIDFTPASGTLTFAVGETTKTIDIPLVAHINSLAQSTLQLLLTSVGGNGVLDQSVTNINVTSTLSNADFFEADLGVVRSNTGVATVTVYRTGNLSSGGTMNFSALPAAGSANLMFVPTTGVVSFAAGQHEATFTVPLLTDTNTTPTETMELKLSGGTGTFSANAEQTASLLVYTSTPLLKTDGIWFPSPTGPVQAPTKKFNHFMIKFTQALQTTPTATDFQAFTRTKDKADGGGTAKPIAISHVSYDAANRMLTVYFKKFQAPKGFFQFMAKPHVLKDMAGREIDGQQNRVSGSELNTYMGVGRALTFIDQDGDKVTLKLKGPGVIRILRRGDGNAAQVSIFDDTAKTKLVGAVKVAKNSPTGKATIPQIHGLDISRILLPLNRFDILQILDA